MPLALPERLCWQPSFCLELQTWFNTRNRCRSFNAGMSSARHVQHSCRGHGASMLTPTGYAARVTTLSSVIQQHDQTCEMMRSANRRPPGSSSAAIARAYSASPCV